MRGRICVVIVAVVLSACSSSSNSTGTTEIGPVPVSPIVTTTPADSIAVADTTPDTAQITTTSVAPPANATAELPDPLEACQRLEGAVTTFSPIAEGQDPPGLVTIPDGGGYGCSMTWQERPPNSSLLRANLLIYTKEKMTSEMDRVGYTCDSTPDIVPGWPEAFTCDRMSADGPASLIWLDKDGESISLSIRGEFVAGFTPQNVVDILEIVLGPTGTVTAPVVPVVPSTIVVVAPPTTGSAAAQLPSATWNGAYVTEPSSGALQIGDRGERVKELQRNLGFASLLDPPYDGYFGPDTEHAVAEFQQQAGFRVDGIAGPEVLQALQPD